MFMYENYPTRNQKFSRIIIIYNSTIMDLINNINEQEMSVITLLKPVNLTKCKLAKWFKLQYHNKHTGIEILSVKRPSNLFAYW